MTICAVVLVAAGRGSRGGPGLPKQYRPVGGRSPIVRCLDLLSGMEDLESIQVVIHPDDRSLYDQSDRDRVLPPPVTGGATRQASVLTGLVALEPKQPDLVLIHDAARPFASPDLMQRAIQAARHSGAAIPTLAITDTVKVVNVDGRVTGTADRTTLRAAQTPQVFAFAPLLKAHRRARREGLDDFSDDAALAEWAGLSVSTFPGEPSNIKLTTADDFARAEAMLRDRLADVRTGMGFDVHAFGGGNRVMLGGIPVAHDFGLAGHSDADVVLHALVDAILGAIAEGDIGAHFPPSDPQWRGASSDRFLRFAADRVYARQGVIAHLDVTVVCEAPKIGPHRDAMRARIAEIAGLDLQCVSVKATTSEGLGFTGRREGIAAYAMATIRLPGS